MGAQALAQIGLHHRNSSGYPRLSLVLTMSGGKSQELIQQLLQAEKQAEELIATAKKNRIAKLRQAKEKAEEDLKSFREEQESKFVQETGNKSKADPAAELRDATKKELDMVSVTTMQTKRKLSSTLLTRFWTYLSA